jgi:hypothetical protein
MRSLLVLTFVSLGTACNCQPPAVVTDGGTGGGGGSSAGGGTAGGSGSTGGGSAMGGGSGGGSSGGGSAGSTSQHFVGGTCIGCAAFPGTPNDGGTSGLGDLGNAPMCMGASVNPTLVYPNDGALFPPNTNVIEVQFLPGTGNTLFEVDFENSITDVRVETKCTPITNAVGGATGGCGVTLDAATWAYIASNNAGLDPLTVTVRGTPDGSCVAGSNSRTMMFAAEPVEGVIYYWQSVVFGTLQGTSGGIYRYNFGTQAAFPSPFLVPTGTSAFAGRCIGCHFISRDGQKMTFGNDDADADDEYSDLKTSMLDVASFSATGATLNLNLSPGFQTFSPDHSLFFASDGLNKNTPASLFLYNGNTGAAATPAKAPTTARVTQPDWSAGGTKIVGVKTGTVWPSGNGQCTGCAMAPPMMQCPSAPPYSCSCNPPTGTNNLDDNHFSGGSIVTMDLVDAGVVGAPSVLVGGANENDFYPAWAPDDAVVVFNRVSGDGGLADDAFSNPRAQIFAVPVPGGAPVELTKMESAGVTNDATHPFASGGLTNSWPRFSPFVQMYKGKRLYWVTFSSTRDYGLRVQNQVMGEINCYPPEGPENACSGKQQLTQPNCAQPQIWMAAFTEDGLVSGDTSFPAFWLPFQSIAAHNHIAQWAAVFVGDAGTPPMDGGITEQNPDGGACAPFNGSCMTSADCCDQLTCIQPSNTCQYIIQ